MRHCWSMPLIPNEMIEAIESLASQPKNLALLVSKGLEHAKEFSWNRCANQTLQAYKADMIKSNYFQGVSLCR